MEKFKTLNETELISVVGGKPKKKGVFALM